LKTVGALFALALLGCHPSASSPKPVLRCDAPSPTYEADVRPVLERRCFSCHANGGVAALDHDFSHFEKLRAESQALFDEVSEHGMPPPPRPPLEGAEAAILLRWIACGKIER
jgi:hypothetical protein